MKNPRLEAYMILFLCFVPVSGLLSGPARASARPPLVTHGDLRHTEAATTDPEDASSDSQENLLQQYRKGGNLCLTLNDCIGIALKQNRDIHLVTETLTQADTDITRARSAMLPFFGAEASYTRLDEPITFAMGPISATFIDRNLFNGGVVVRQPVFMGGRLNAARKAAQYARDARVQEKQSVEEEIAFQVSRAYHTAQVAEAFRGVAVDALDLLKTHAHDVAILVREGANPELDLLRTRTDLANAQKNLNAAENAVDLSLSALKNLMVVDLEEPLSLKEHLSRPPRPAQVLFTLTSLAVSRRPELYALRSQVEAAKQGLSAAKGEYWPTIGLEGRYEYMQGDFRDLDGGYHWTVGVGAQMPLWNWGETSAKVRKARSQLKQAKIRFKKTEDLIRLQVRRAFLDLGKAEKNIAATESGLATAKEAYRLSTAAYKEGAGTNTEVLDARTALSRAQANHVQALFEYNVSLAALQRAIGAPVMKKEKIGNKEESIQ